MTLVGDRGQEFDYARILRSTENRENFYSMLERAGGGHVEIYRNMILDSITIVL